MSEEGHSFLFFLVVQEERGLGTILFFTKELVTSFWARGNLGKFNSTAILDILTAALALSKWQQKVTNLRLLRTQQ